MDVINTRIEIITPERALELLGTNNGNRKISAILVDRLSSALRAGDFICTNNGIGLDQSGNLIDGQHRLSAIVKTGISAKMVVCTYSGNTTAKFIPLDCGKPRSLADYANLNRQEAAMLTFCIRDVMGLKYIQGEAKKLISGLGENMSYVHRLSTIHKKFVPSCVRVAFLINKLGGKDYDFILDDMISMEFKNPITALIFKNAINLSGCGEVQRKNLFYRTMIILDTGTATLTDLRIRNVMQFSQDCIAKYLV